MVLMLIMRTTTTTTMGKNTEITLPEGVIRSTADQNFRHMFTSTTNASNTTNTIGC